MKNRYQFLLIIAVIALLTIAGHFLVKMNQTEPAAAPEQAAAVAAAPAQVEAKVAPVQEEKAPIPAAVADKPQAVDFKIDASSDKAMVDSLDYISRKLNHNEQLRLQNDFNVISSALGGNASDDGKKGSDSLAKLRETINGKTAAELSQIAERLKAAK
jgi:hypothetical protein